MCPNWTDQNSKNSLYSILSYICEIYTDFEAFKNDTEILRKILRSDRRLTGIIGKEDFFFLDRG